MPVLQLMKRFKEVFWLFVSERSAVRTPEKRGELKSHSSGRGRSNFMLHQERFT